jgi:hypothetical protein
MGTSVKDCGNEKREAGSEKAECRRAEVRSRYSGQRRATWLAGVTVLLLCFGLALAAKTCSNCGTENGDAAKFCKSCGAKLPESEPVRPQRPRVSGSVSVAGQVVTIVSDPAGASVIIDGRGRGLTPLEVSDLSAGRHELVLSRDGYRDYNTSFTVSSQSGTIVVTSDPVGADVLLDGQSRGRTVEGGLALSRVPFGSHSVTAQLSGYRDVTKTLELHSTGPVAMNFRLGWGRGALSVQSAPAGALVRAENRSLGTTPFVTELAPNRYLLSVTRPGYFEWIGYAQVEFAETASVSVELERIKVRSPILLAVTGAALAGTGLAVAMGEAQYAKYRSASDPADVRHYREATNQWDMARNIGSGVTAALAVGFLVLRF